MTFEYPYKRRQTAPRNARYAEKGVWPFRKPRLLSSNNSGQIERLMMTGSDDVTWAAILRAADEGLSIMQVNAWLESRSRPAARAESRPPPIVSRLRAGNVSG